MIRSRPSLQSRLEELSHDFIRLPRFPRQPRIIPIRPRRSKAMMHIQLRFISTTSHSSLEQNTHKVLPHTLLLKRLLLQRLPNRIHHRLVLPLTRDQRHRHIKDLPIPRLQIRRMNKSYRIEKPFSCRGGLSKFLAAETKSIRLHPNQYSSISSSQI